MAKNIFFAFVWLLALPSTFANTGVPVSPKILPGVVGIKHYTVKQVSGSVKLEGTQLKIGDNLDEEDLEHIKMARNACFMVVFQGKQEMYCAEPNCASNCRPVNKPLLISVGDRSDESDDGSN